MSSQLLVLLLRLASSPISQAKVIGEDYREQRPGFSIAGIEISRSFLFIEVT